MQVKNGYCTRFNFIDEELPSGYYKDLLFELHSQTKSLYSQDCRPAMENEDGDLNAKLVKVMEELTFSKSKLKIYDQMLYVLISVVAFLCLIIAVLVF